MTWKICPNCWQSNAAELTSCRRCSASLEVVPVAGKSVVSDESGGPEKAAPTETAEQHSFTNAELSEMLFQANSKIRELRRDLQAVKKSLPNSMILDQNLFERALAVYGHMMLFSLIIGIPLFCLQMLLLYAST